MEAWDSPELAMPVGPRAAVSPALLDSVRDGWGLGMIAELTGLADVGGTYNLNVRLQTERGDLVMRVYRPWVRPERLASVQALREALWQAGVPVITPLVRPDGSKMLIWGDRLIEIEPWVSSDGGADSRDRYQAAAVQLGSLHAALREVRLAVPFAQAPVSNVLSETVFRDWLARTRRAVSDAPAAPQRSAALLACDDAEHLRAWLRALPRHEPLTHLTHGDFGHDNVRYFGPAPVAVLDFDFADRRDRLTDIAYRSYWMFEHLAWDRPAATRDWRQVSGIIAGYGTTAGIALRRDEIRSLPLAMAAIPLSWIAEAWLMDDPVAAIGLVAPQLAVADWLLANHGDLSAMWSADQR